MNKLFFVLFSHNLIFCFGVSAEKEIVVVTASYNNENWVERNLTSIFSQKYKNWHLIYMDDYSSDKTKDVVQAMIKKHNKEDQVTFIDSKQRNGHGFNQFYAIHLCNDRAIIVILDGDDWLAHDRVFEKLNQVYSDNDVWLTYGQYKEHPSRKIGICQDFLQEVIEKNDFRNHRWITSHLRTFYAWLYKAIKQDDMMYGGSFFPCAVDVACMIPMLEMANTRIAFIPDVLCIYNRANVLNIEKNRKTLSINQKQAFEIIRQRKKYSILATCPKNQ